MRAIFIRQVGAMNVWLVTDNGNHFFVNWTMHHSKQDIEDYYND